METEYSFRTLNYLGSKLRLLDFIEDNVRKVTPEDAGVCDLFAGSGCVSYRLSRNYPVVSCDIQHYSRVISNALLDNLEVTQEDAELFLSQLETVKNSPLYKAFEPLIHIEEQAIKTKQLEVLTDIIEHGSVEVYCIEGEKSNISHLLRIVADKLSSNGLNNVQSLISRYYGGVYFSYRQAVEIDYILEHIYQKILQRDRDIYIAALLSTASDIADTVGKHFAQPLKARDSKGNIKSLVYNKAVKDKTMSVMELYCTWLRKYVSSPKREVQHQAIQGDYMYCLENLPDNVKTVYADPPYTRDHYSRFYHVLETITLRDIPTISTVTIHGKTHVSNGIYRAERHQSPFCICSKAPGAFRLMFEKIANSGRNLLLSYSPYDESKKTHPRVVTISQLTELAKQYFNNVEIVSAGHFSHNKLNSAEHFLESSDEAEILIVCTCK